MFGELIAPLDDLVKNSNSQNQQTRAKASAKFSHDKPVFLATLNIFCNGESGHVYAVESAAITAKLNGFSNSLISFRDEEEILKDKLQELKKSVLSSIVAIPCEIDSEVLEAGSPFTAYVKLKSIIETAVNKVIFIDPYMAPTIVNRYFNLVSENTQVTVITKFRRGRTEFDDFLSLSKLYANQVGSEKYTLKFHDTNHDRYLQCDDDVYHLGGSLKDAGDKSSFTITKVRSIAEGEIEVNKLISESSEQFGLLNTVHP